MSAPEPIASHTPVETAITGGRTQWGGDWRPTLQASAPGRVELLGNHVDYNGGPVLAAAIDRRAVVLADIDGATPDTIEVCFADTGSVEQFGLADLEDWRNTSDQQAPLDYAKGAAAALIARELPVRAAQLSVSSAVPAGIGVSSSAALCLALSLAMSERVLSTRDLILIAQEAEHRAGTPCGTMDQSASVAGGVILFGGAELTYRSLRPDLGEMAFLVIDSGVHRSLAYSSYPVRVEECARARALVANLLRRPVEHLAQIREDELQHLSTNTLSAAERTLMKRVRHVVHETARVIEGTQALERSDWARFGALMTASGRSSAEDYEISHPVVEELVARLRTDPSVLGARMMGGGEGGSLIAIAEHGASDDVRERLSRLVNEGLPAGDPRRQVFAFNFAEGASIKSFDQ